jgi:PTH1 family peptidyl-tRNA hydrolase
MDQNSERQFPRLIIGLGNPGERYQANRHNLGFQVVEAVAGRMGLSFVQEDARYLATPAGYEPDSCVMLKPLTYMNLSGEAVTAWLDRHDLEPVPGRVLVICDDLALPLGTLRLRGKGSSGGQNGLASIIEHLDSDRICRLRLGIDGTEGQIEPEQWPDYVLADFTAGEKEAAGEMVDRAVLAVICWLEEGLEKAASRFNGRPEPDPED